MMLMSRLECVEAEGRKPSGVCFLDPRDEPEGSRPAASRELID
jgi:hypothetical protein